MNGKDHSTQDNYIYGKRIKELRIQMGLTQNEVAAALEVSPGYISNVENGRASMSLRMLIYYSKLTNMSLDSLIGRIEPEYTETALDNELTVEIRKLSVVDKEKLLRMIKIWQE